jgi:hypothetical protein
MARSRLERWRKRSKHASAMTPDAGKGEGHAHKTGEALPEGSVPALDVGRFSRLASPPPCAAPPGSLPCLLPKRRSRHALGDIPLQWPPTTADTSGRLRSPTADATTCRLWRQRAIPIQEACAFLSTHEPSAERVAGWETWDLGDRQRAAWSTKAEAELLFGDPTGDRGTRDTKGASEAPLVSRVLELACRISSRRACG